MLSIRQAFPRPPFKSCHFPCLLHVVQRGWVPPARSGFKKQNHLTASPVLLCPDPFLSLAFSLSGTLGALESRKDTAPALPRGLPSSQAPAHSHPPSRPEPPPRSGGPTLSSSVFVRSFESTIPSASDNTQSIYCTEIKTNKVSLKTLSASSIPGEALGGTVRDDLGLSDARSTRHLTGEDAPQSRTDSLTASL